MAKNKKRISVRERARRSEQSHKQWLKDNPELADRHLHSELEHYPSRARIGWHFVG